MESGEDIRIRMGTTRGPVWAVAELFGESRSLLVSKAVFLDGKEGGTGSLAELAFKYQESWPDAVNLRIFPTGGAYSLGHAEDLADRLWLLLVPLVGIPFSVLFGLFLNLKFPKLHWENATEVVKQSAASGLSLLGGFAILLPGVGAMVLPDGYRHLLNPVMILVIAGVSWLLYRKVMSFPLEKLES